MLYTFFIWSLSRLIRYCFLEQCVVLKSAKIIKFKNLNPPIDWFPFTNWVLTIFQHVKLVSTRLFQWSTLKKQIPNTIITLSFIGPFWKNKYKISSETERKILNFFDKDLSYFNNVPNVNTRFLNRSLWNQKWHHPRNSGIIWTNHWLLRS